ncbi:sugar phosphate isomerase/epimerase [Treponema sp. OttesenSCG-928-L16]|nr:sugar phosphate isomerase/epimerase [Treponema sp. OttesenSCG-928-L16]
MRPGLWTGFFLLHQGPVLENAFALLSRAGFSVCELDERSAASLLLGRPDWEDSLAALVRLSSESGVQVTQMHAPAPSADIGKQKSDIEILARSCEVLGCRTLVIHPFTGRERGEPKISRAGEWTSFWGALFKENLEMLSVCARTAEDRGVRLALENQIDAKGPGGRWTGGHPADMERFFDQIPSLGLNLDTAHACAQGLDIPSLISWAGSRLYGLHVSDSDGRVHDYHIMPGKGVLPWTEIMGALKKSGYAGDFHMELVHERSEDPSLSAAAAMEAKQTAENLLGIYAGSGGDAC